MRLTEPKYYQFLRIHLSLIHFTGINEGLLSEKMNLEEFKDADVKTKFLVREALYENPKYFDKFVKENPYDLSNEDLQVADNFRYFILSSVTRSDFSETRINTRLFVRILNLALLWER